MLQQAVLNTHDSPFPLNLHRTGDIVGRQIEFESQIRSDTWSILRGNKKPAAADIASKAFACLSLLPAKGPAEIDR